MPSFLRRRYNRKQVSAIERLIAILLLAVLAMLVTSMVWTVRQPDQPLFAIPAEYRNEATPSHDDLLAAQLLPATLADGVWTVADASIVVEQGGTSPTFKATYRSNDASPQSAEVAVVVFADAAGAQADFEGSQPAGAQADEALLLSVVGQTELGMGHWVADGRLGFWSGRTLTRVTAATSELAAAVAGALAGRQLVYGPASATPSGVAEVGAAIPAVAKAKRLLPEPAAAGWLAPDNERVFGPTNLYEKINGAATLYHTFGFVRLTFGTYRLASDPEQYVDCYVYNMGSVENAFGIYKAEQAYDVETVAIGREGYRADQSLFFFKGPDYVQLMPPDGNTAYAEFVTALAGQLADGIEDDGSPIWADAVLPQAHRVADSFAFIRSDAFSLDFLGNVYTADYADGDASWTLFVHRADEPATAHEMLAKHADYLGKYGTLAEQSENRVIGDVAGYYEVVFATGRYFAGVNACPTRQLAETQADALRDVLKE